MTVRKKVYLSVVPNKIITRIDKENAQYYFLFNLNKPGKDNGFKRYIDNNNGKYKDELGNKNDRE